MIVVEEIGTFVGGGVTELDLGRDEDEGAEVGVVVVDVVDGRAGSRLGSLDKSIF